MSMQIINFRINEEWQWTSEAECAKLGAPGMFPSDQDEVGIAWAKQTCNACPVKRTCLQDALDRNEAWGVWGGMTASERQDVKRNAKRRARRTAPVSAQDLEDLAAMDGAA